MLARRLLLLSVGLACLGHRPSWATEPPPPFLTAWGTYGTGPGQFEFPQGIAVDAAGFVYVADLLNHRVSKFTDAGQFVLSWGSPGTGTAQFGDLGGLAIDAVGRVLVADSGNNRVQIFTPDGVFLSQFQIYHPDDIAVGPSGERFVVSNAAIARFDANGTFHGTLGGFDLLEPLSVAVDATGSLYVGDAGYHRVAKFDPNGILIQSWGSEGTGLGQFRGPVGLDLDVAGNVYVADYDNHRVQKFAADGTLLSAWGTQGAGPGEFDVAWGVAIGPDGSIYVTDLDNHRVERFGNAPVSTASPSWGSLKSRYRGTARTPPGVR